MRRQAALQRAVTMIVSNNSIHQSSWLLDSGASSHISNNIIFFEEIDNTYTSKVRVANGQICQVYGIGKGKIECCNEKGEKSMLRLDNVLYVPDFESGLISIGALAKKRYQIRVKNHKMTISKDEHEIAIGDFTSGIYKLRTPDHALTTLSHHPENCIHHWHARFGHRDPKAI